MNDGVLSTASSRRSLVAAGLGTPPPSVATRSASAASSTLAAVASNRVCASNAPLAWSTALRARTLLASALASAAASRSLLFRGTVGDAGAGAGAGVTTRGASVGSLDSAKSTSGVSLEL